MRFSEVLGDKHQIHCYLCLEEKTFNDKGERTLLAMMDDFYILIWDMLNIAKFRLKLKKVEETTRPFRYDLNQIPRITQWK